MSLNWQRAELDWTLGRNCSLGGCSEALAPSPLLSCTCWGISEIRSHPLYLLQERRAFQSHIQSCNDQHTPRFYSKKRKRQIHLYCPRDGQWSCIGVSPASPRHIRLVQIMKIRKSRVALEQILSTNWVTIAIVCFFVWGCQVSKALPCRDLCSSKQNWGISQYTWLHPYRIVWCSETWLCRAPREGRHLENKIFWAKMKKWLSVCKSDAVLLGKHLAVWVCVLVFT